MKLFAEQNGDEGLHATLLRERPLREETLSVLRSLFVSAAGELTSENGTAGLKGPRMRSVETVISALKQSRDYETLFNLAICSSVPGRPRFLAELCIDATLQSGEESDLYYLALDYLDVESEGPVQTVIVQSAARILLRLGENGYRPAYLTIGDLFKDGIGLARDVEEARSWYLKAVLANSYEAANLASNVAAAFRELLEMLQTTQESEAMIRTAEFFRLQICLAEEFSDRVKAMLPEQGVDCLIQKGETGRIEFKETLRWDTQKGIVNAHLEDAVVQTVSAFMNTDGGALFIGVRDDKMPVGLQPDFDSFSKERDRNRDGFERHLRQILRRDLGKNTHLCSIDFIPYPGMHICRITVKPSPEPVFAREGQKVWIRDGNSKRALAGDEWEEYRRRRWPV